MHRSLVHRRSTHEVLPTDFVDLGADTFEIAIQWPRRHPLWKTNPLRSSLIAETIRQSTILTCHLGYSVSPQTRFLMTGLGFDLAGEPLRALPGEAIEIRAHASGSRVRRSARGLRSVRIGFSFSQNGAPIASGHGDAMLVDDSTYLRLRGSHAGAHPPARIRQSVISPADVGVDASEDILLEGDRHGWVVAVDGSHSTYFDHPLDHVPGVALVEACRQLACVETGDPTLDLRTFEAEFVRTVEFSSPARASIQRSGDGACFVITQDDAIAVDASAVVASAVATTSVS
ncbi:ScbA/BarX family gamma-butyrolactone biosynthesis protein [Agromyces larvae]|uniref:A-factor biosynthesis hotdog domain-containing protein n=1 Tax=Agromyces larvae TaxID=2929802 RepID=A0ABY4BUE9_9MICO|nr:ScbA/BarX family gamma-butyrolactone biosynthesis protein [Agromyces larvae]UOE42832.1 hypothetical protein MTO99_11590 [Agromyces larvae]